MSARFAALLAAGLTLAGMYGCQNEAAPPVTNSTPAAAVQTGPGDGVSGNGGTSGANAASDKQKAARPAFNGEKAFAQLKKQCDFGPRPVGSEAHEKTKDYLIAEMKKYADETITQKFAYRGMPVTNIIGVFYPAGASKPDPRPVLLMAHWDTRPIADGPFSSEIKNGVRFRFGPQGWKPETPIIGANDGASGVAALLELARLFKEKRPPVGVLILLDDGEDYGDFDANGGEGVLMGAKHFAAHFQETKAFGLPEYGILLDMVGAKNLIIPREGVSQRFAPGTLEKVFTVAESLGYGNVFLSSETHEVGDDHVPINMAGIPTIDLIHPLPFREYAERGYRFWHTHEDTPDKCSPQSLKIVGETVAEVIYRETPRQ